MAYGKIVVVLVIGLCLAMNGVAAPMKPAGKHHILVVDSYDKRYSWTTETNEGFCAAMLKLGYFDDKEQTAEYTRNDYAETSKAIFKKVWMNTKQKTSKEDISQVTQQVVEIVRDFKPDILLLGEDNAANYIGSHFLDTKLPIVFWGMDNTPVKYGLVENEDKPGHNVTGVYQSGYYGEGIELLRRMKPGIQTFAVLSDDTSTGRSHAKKIEYFVRKGEIPLRLIKIVMTNDFETWKKNALELQDKVDAFFVAQITALKDEKGNNLSTLEVVRWYTEHIKIPEATRGTFVKDGLLCAADDSGYKQGYEAGLIAHDILAKGAKPATYAPRTPERGALMVNTKRAKALGISFTPAMGIEKFIDE